MQIMRLKLSIGSLRNDDSNGKVSASNQWFDWLDEEK